MSASQNHAAPLRTLVVCKANICRSATAGFALSPFKSLAVQSAGIDATNGMKICRTAAQHICQHPGGAEYIEDFASRSIHVANPTAFEILLTATAQIRSEVLGLFPELRDRTFTFIEADRLASNQLSLSESELLLQSGPSAVLIQRRGSVPTLASKNRWFGGKGITPIDLPDTHNASVGRKHQTTIERALELGQRLGETLERWNTLPALSS